MIIIPIFHMKYSSSIAFTSVFRSKLTEILLKYASLNSLN